eukprot:CAMPEP_0194274268 /NCGR_PEP_ID=MMETSP0169-20130528/7386_1 /TAXON_ID=218684 /ORGANISM="Corethron pennatum, Strain L29A3" /LENGTH=301 /DNA_ID=CAMNT_0039017409 /DNA_START=84 /DNA_END=985 /DNA_ORIENTATION=-
MSPLLHSDDAVEEGTAGEVEDGPVPVEEITAPPAGTAPSAPNDSDDDLLYESFDRPPPAAAPPPATSLAAAPSTPRCVAVLISLLAFAAHGMFLYGQIAPMWRLHATADIDVWLNATSMVTRQTFAAVGIDLDNRVEMHRDEDVESFTYAFAVRKLWKAAGLPSKTASRAAAVALVGFSGVWPHLKLLLLQATFFFPYRPSRVGSRTKALYWLGTFGKWSLADVFVCCAMIGIIRLDWVIDPAAVRDGLGGELLTLVQVAKSLYPTAAGACTKLLNFECNPPAGLVHKTKCWACQVVVKEA